MPNARAERKAKELLEKVLENSKDRVVLKTWTAPDFERRGYIVKGQCREYFIEENIHLDIYTYPEGKHICMVETKKGSFLPHSDRLVSRILALLNDKKLADKIPTLKKILQEDGCL
jgi:hypothetical protein